MNFGSLSRFVSSAIKNPVNDCSLIQGMTSLSMIGLAHQYQQIRTKKMIKFCGYLEPAEFKKRDIRYKTSTRHDPKRMTWHDYQFRSWKAVHWKKPYPLWQAKMDYAENLCRLGMSDSSIEQITQLHPHCIQYLKRKLSGNVVLLRDAEYSNYVNHRTGDHK